MDDSPPTPPPTSQRLKKRVNLSEAFPISEPLARFALRAFVLYGDLQIEQPGIVDDKGLEALDEVSADWRRYFFVRSNVRSLYETRILIQALNGDERFKEWRSQGGDFIAERWRKCGADLHALGSQLTDDRNAIGGHVGEQIGELVGQFKPFENWPHAWSESIGMQPTIATYLLMRVQFAEFVDSQDGTERVEKRIQMYSNATGAALEAVGIFLRMYIQHHPVLQMPGADSMPFAKPV